MRRQVLLAVVVMGLLLSLPSICRAQIYAGAAVGAGGARTPIGSYASGFRGLLRLYGGYEFTRNVAAEAMTFDLGTPENKPGNDSTIGAIAVAAVGTLPVQRWRFTGRVGVMSMDGRALGVTTRSPQGMVGFGAGFAVLRRLTIGLETAVSRVKFAAPVNDTTRVNWTGAAATFTF
jgi:hypothetical protein